VIGALLGLIIDALFSNPVGDKVRWFQRWLMMKLRASTVGTPTPETFRLGDRDFPFLVIDGDGKASYRKDTIETRLEESPQLPEEIMNFRSMIEKRESLKKSNGLQAQWNGPLVGLKRYAIRRTIPEEDLAITLTFFETDYFTFLATVGSLDVNLHEPPAYFSLRQKYLANPMTDFQPIPFLAQGFGIALVAIGADGKLIFALRSPDSGIRPNELDVTVVESVHPYLDASPDQPGPDLYKTAVRGAKEEAGFEIQENQITFLGFGVDQEYYQWEMIGLIRLNLSADEALSSRSRGTGGKWETRRFQTISSNPKTVFQFLKYSKLWAIGWVAVYWALVHEYGSREVDEAARRVFRHWP
jgi:hypothetical protein